MHFFTYIGLTSFTKVMQDYERTISLIRKFGLFNYVVLLKSHACPDLSGEPVNIRLTDHSLMCKINAHGSFHLCNFIFLQRNKIYVMQKVVLTAIQRQI